MRVQSPHPTHRDSDSWSWILSCDLTTSYTVMDEYYQLDVKNVEGKAVFRIRWRLKEFRKNLQVEA